MLPYLRVPPHKSLNLFVPCGKARYIIRVPSHYKKVHKVVTKVPNYLLVLRICSHNSKLTLATSCM